MKRDATVFPLALMFENVQREAHNIAAKLDDHEFPNIERLIESLYIFCDALRNESPEMLAFYQPEMEKLAIKITEWREMVQVRSNHLRRTLTSISSNHKAFRAYAKSGRPSRMVPPRRQFYGGL